MDGSHAIGVDLGGTKILAGVVARDGEVVRRHERATPQDSQESVVRELEAAVSELLDDEVAAIGFGVPSPIDQVTGVVVECVNLPLRDFALRDHMARAIRPRRRASTTTRTPPRSASGGPAPGAASTTS